MSEEQFKKILTKKQLIESAAVELLERCEEALHYIGWLHIHEPKVADQLFALERDLEKTIRKAKGEN